VRNKKLSPLELLVVMYLIPILLVVASTVQSHHYLNELKKAKAQSTVYQNEANYERLGNTRLLGRIDELEADLAEAKGRLADSAAREKLWRSRASRSRSAVASERLGAFSGGLHDITMYCATGNRTASGLWPKRGMVATLSRSIPFGTRISIEGVGIFVVEDRIGRGSEFDIFTPDCSEAPRFGRQHRRVTILD